jgi:hypothetical protein
MSVKSPRKSQTICRVYSGYENSYHASSGTLPNPVLELPQGAIYLATALGASLSQGLVLENAGATSLSWSGSSTQAWLTLQTSSGTIAAESSTPATGAGSVMFTADPTGLSAGTYTAVVTFAYGSQSRKIDVVLVVQ